MFLTMREEEALEIIKKLCTVNIVPKILSDEPKATMV